MSKVYDKTGEPLGCYYGDCQKIADDNWKAPAVLGNELVYYCFCSMEHQILQLKEWGEA
jgi:hypothetical protein